jgi:hypothetical protein
MGKIHYHVISITASFLACAVSCETSKSDSMEGRLGFPCDTSEQCKGDLYCDGNDSPTAGMCTSSCYSPDACTEYGDKAFCIGAERCVWGCETNDDCREDQYCSEPGNWCMRKYCSNDDQCHRFSCNPMTGMCYESCSSDLQCNTGYRCPVEYSIFECVEIF